MQRLEATPGMTGLWQVKERAQVSVDQMASLDIEHINRQGSHQLGDPVSQQVVDMAKPVAGPSRT